MVPSVTVVGLGLLGGSLALALRQRAVAGRVVGVDREGDVCEVARQRGLVDEATSDLPAGVACADLVVFCTPVDRIVEGVAGAAPHCRAGTLLTDVGSTKAEIVRQLAGRLPPGVVFVGSHPLAGSEKSGPAHARADLFTGRLVLVTPVAGTAPADVARVSALWQAIGAGVVVLDPEEHDRALALTSHLPHLLASALAGVLPADWASLTGSGFRDTTRLAAGNPEVWTAILHTNREAVLSALDRVGTRLEAFRRALAGGQRGKLEELLREGKEVREGLAD